MGIKRTLRAAQVVEVAKKPMASAHRASLFARRIEVALSSAAAELLIKNAQVLSEGQVEGGRFFGSTIVTLDLRRLEGEVSDAVSAETASRFGTLAADDRALQERTRSLAIAEASRLAGYPIRNPQVDVRVRARGPHIRIDIDVEANARKAGRRK